MVLQCLIHKKTFCYLIVFNAATLDPLGFFVGFSLGKTLQSPCLTLVKPVSTLCQLLPWYDWNNLEGPGKGLNNLVCKTLMPTQQPFFQKLWPWYLTLTMTDDLEFGTSRKVLSQGILIRNTKALSLTDQKIWMANVKVFADQQKDTQTNWRAKKYMLYQRWGIKRRKY